MEKRYTLPVAIALVVGTVIGSGIFFKAENVLKGTGGNLGVGVLAFVIMGFVMIISAGTFGIVAQSHEGIEGLVGYARASCGKTYGYYMGWFMATVYYPSLTGVLSWLPARYFGVLLGWDDPIFSGRTMALAGGFLVLTYAMNALAPKLAGKFAISTTVIKLIPLLLMAVVGTVVGLSSGMTKFNFTHVVTDIPFAQGLFGAVVALAFAFEGWICATSIGAELKDSKKTMPRALRIGTLIVAKYDEEFDDDDLLLCEYGATVVGMEMLRDHAEKIEIEARKKATVQIAINTLSFSERKAAYAILSALDSTEGQIGRAHV